MSVFAFRTGLRSSRLENAPSLYRLHSRERGDLLSRRDVYPISCAGALLRADSAHALGGPRRAVAPTQSSPALAEARGGCKHGAARRSSPQQISQALRSSSSNTSRPSVEPLRFSRTWIGERICGGPRGQDRTGLERRAGAARRAGSAQRRWTRLPFTRRSTTAAIGCGALVRFVQGIVIS